MADKKYRVVASYQIFKCEHASEDHSADVPMHGAKEVTWDDMEYDDVVDLEGAIMGALATLGINEKEKKKKKAKDS